ncbi:MAG: hypothetical protein RIT81_12540 [Deltaproteobacteria bacterium]
MRGTLAARTNSWVPLELLTARAFEHRARAGSPLKNEPPLSGTASIRHLSDLRKESVDDEELSAGARNRAPMKRPP